MENTMSMVENQDLKGLKDDALFSSLMTSINDIFNSDLNDVKMLERKVSFLLRILLIDPSIDGFHFLKDAIILGIREPEYLGGVVYRLYPKIAEFRNSTPSKVERAIRHAISKFELVDENDLPAEIQKIRFYIFGPTYKKRKLTNAVFISSIVEAIR